MLQNTNIFFAPKTSNFQIRINPEIKKQVEAVYAAYGLTLTDAVNIFIQQSINENGLPFLLSAENAEYKKAKATQKLLSELQAGWDSVQNDGDWVSEEEAYKLLESDE